MTSKMAANTNIGKHSFEIKRKTIAYYNENQIPKHIEDLLNRMYKENPGDIFGYMAEYFGKLSKPPKISKVDCREVLSSRGYPSFIIELFCTINGLEKLVSSVTAPVDNCPAASISRLKSKTPDPKARTPDLTQGSVTAGLDVTESKLEISELIVRVESVILPLVQGVCPDKLQAVDGILSDLEQHETNLSKPSSTSCEEKQLNDCTAEVDKPGCEDKSIAPEPHECKKPSTLQPSGKRQSAASKKEPVSVVPDLEEEQVFQDYAMLGVSVVAALAGATLNNCPLYDFICFPRADECQQIPQKMTVPIPVMTVLTSGKWAAGKQNMIKDVMISPKPAVPMKQGIEQLVNIYHQLGNTTSARGGGIRCITDDGSFSPAMDKPEQALDYVHEAVEACGLTLGSDIHIIINCAATDYYDHEKQKYEVTANGFKSTDDLINMYCDLHERYPGLVGIVDGVRAADKEGWIKLSQRLGEKCFIIGNEIYRRHPSVLLSGIHERVSSAAVLSLDQANTLSGVVDKANSIHEQGGLVLMSECLPKDTSVVVVDMAVSVGARFVTIGGPARTEHVYKYGRLQMIEEELEKKERLLPQQPHVFPVVNGPEPEEKGGESEVELKE